MSRSWYVERYGKTAGPVTSAQLKQLAAAGNIDHETRVRLGEDGEWILAARVQGLFRAAETSSPKEASASHRPPTAVVAAPVQQPPQQSVTTEKTILGKWIVRYDCPKCGVRMKSSLSNAGTEDRCADCGSVFIVPAEEKRIEVERIEAFQKKKKEKVKEHKRKEQQEIREAEKARREKEAPRRAIESEQEQLRQHDLQFEPPPESRMNAAPQSETRQCPFCAETISVDAKKCKHCKEFLDGTRPATARPQVPEQLLWESRQSRKILYLHIMLSCLLIPVCGIGLLTLIVVVVNYYSNHYTVTNKRVIQRFGMISRQTSEVQLAHIRSINLSQGIVSRAWGVGSLGIASAGHAGVEVTIKDIDDPLAIKELIVSLSGPTG